MKHPLAAMASSTLIAASVLLGAGVTATAASAAPATLPVLGTASVRLGPGADTPVASTAKAGSTIRVTCKVSGKALTNANGYTSNVWYRTGSGNYIWDGTVDTTGTAINKCAGGEGAVARFITEYNGRSFDSDGGAPGECFDVANQFSMDSGFGRIYTRGQSGSSVAQVASNIYLNYANNGNAAKYDKIENKGMVVPRAGDIIVWGSGTRLATDDNPGHVAVVVRADTSTFTVVEQNSPYQGAPTRVSTKSWADHQILGWLRPKAWNN